MLGWRTRASLLYPVPCQTPALKIPSDKIFVPPFQLNNAFSHLVSSPNFHPKTQVTGLKEIEFRIPQLCKTCWDGIHMHREDCKPLVELKWHTHTNDFHFQV